MFHFPSQPVANIQNYLRMLLEVRQGPVLKPVRNTGPTDSLLPYTSNHLGYVNEGAWKDRKEKKAPHSQMRNVSLMSCLHLHEGQLFSLVSAQQNRTVRVREAFLLLVLLISAFVQRLAIKSMIQPTIFHFFFLWVIGIHAIMWLQSLYYPGLYYGLCFTQPTILTYIFCFTISSINILKQYFS